MAIQTIRPDSTVAAASWSRTGGTTKHGVLADDSDATYLEGSDTTDGQFGMASYVLAAGEAVRQIRTRARCTGGEAWYTVNGGPSGSEIFVTRGSVITAEGGWSTVGLDPNVGSYPGSHQAVIDTLNGHIAWTNPPPAVRFHELYVDLDVWARTDAPVVTIPDATAGVVDGTDQPTVESHTPALNDGTPSAWRWQVKVFRDDVYLAPGFDPTTETDYEFHQLTGPTSISTDPGNPDAVQVDGPLPNDTYRAYVRYGKPMAFETLYSEWSFSEFEVSVVPPGAPTVDVVVDQPGGRQEVTVTTAALTNDSVERLRVQRSDDAGATWATIRDGLLTDGLAGSTAYVFHDYDAPRDVSLLYRARTTETTTEGLTLTSDWTTSTAETHPNDHHWWLYDVDRWTSILAGARIAVDPETTIVSDVGVFHPLGRSGEAVVVSGTSHGDDGTYQLRATGTDETADLDAIVRFKGVVLVKSPFGDQKYVVWIARVKVLSGTPAQPRHTWTLEYVEAGAGIGADG